ncbi:GFA family protein [uncultured Erythrobacter sp.]|uniref:GFA family protein n=1 Tax=uncultured Erythrobacter sp. TaxID=263913 RepID=UPI0026318079|nr:GFA family protein [uncultured Erythrobacter sp.]
MTARTASCQCGELTAACTGEPVAVSVCHCLACQKRSGAPFAAQARFAKDCVAFAGQSKTWERRGDEGALCTNHFCPNCGSNVWFTVDIQPDVIAVPVGAFADHAFPPPQYSVYEDRQHSWVALVGDDIEHYD